jgi:long-chain acyl-CoA synthetase
MDVATVPDLLRHARETHRKPNAFLVRRAGEWVPVSIEAYASHAEAVAAWLRAKGVAPGDRVGILSESRYEWAVADMAILSIGAISVPLYPTLPAGQIAPLLADAGVCGAFASSAAQREKLELVLAGGELARAGVAVRFVWCFDDSGLPGVARPSAGAAGDGGETAGDDEPPAPAQRRTGSAPEPRPDDVATIIYTSGTTGMPKGVMLTHANIVAEVVLSLSAMKLSASDSYLSFLPLSHVFERINGFHTMIYAGVTIAYSESFDALPRNLREVRPTIVLAVPRMYEKVLGRAVEIASGAGRFTRSIFGNAYRVAVEVGRLKNEGKPIPPWLAVERAIGFALVYGKIARGLGGRSRLRVSGGAPLNREVGLFFRGAGLPIHEGYGLTETSSAISVNTFTRHKVGTVGPLLPDVDVKIADDGEILVRGPLVMKGYWRKPEETNQALEGGWFHTGDIGTFDADGFLLITDRKKDLLVTSGGKKVAPQPIEAALKASTRIQEALVVGDGQKYVAALIVPAPGAAREAIAEDVERVNGTLAQFERVKRFELIPDDMTVEKGLMTPSLKLKRKAVLEYHRAVVERLFRD